ncbi:[protein-PII] uridylyltransferase [Persicimonas caeni]|uniref:Bifunctional uridylyltransferase/uridylyl-removing enzyme n=1 Tax=Persicimonas caeni TaxID=2292766 RepID=A0A4Y6PP86_PERCE|nr:[protein-PII] uridylyltransferase [Persicimonas caeni]QDG49919.1 [protein-PII] uridylyltransferase [Persicimonas caeni]QED31140.1 [protein-PII] uridylyltransferase [Persicimonas caeni]
MTQTPPAVSEAIERHRSERARLAQKALVGADSLQIAAELTELTDRFVLEVWREAAEPRVLEKTAVLALGGYGRRELAFGSDIDVMFELGDSALFDSEELHHSVERFLTWCRDARLKLGHAVRTPAQTREEFESDPRTPISVLDTRALAGQPEASWETVRAPEAADFLRGDDDGVGFVELLMRGYEARLERNGKTVYLLEPDIKSGEGGLRDLNCIHWAGRVRWRFVPAERAYPDIGWTAEFRQKYISGLRWLMGLRHLLHINHEREHDRLTFPDQEKIAAILLEMGGDETSDPNSMAEELMRRHYKEARDISMLTQRLLRRWQIVEGGKEVEVGSIFSLSNGQLALSEDAHRERLAPEHVMEALEQASAHDALLDPVLEMAIADSVEAWGEAEREDKQLNRRFRQLLTDADASPKTSERLLENGILTKLLPEFEPIVCHVQHDVYHVYTTDVHSLKCLERARSLVSGSPDPEAQRWRLFTAVADEVERTEILLLAALFHDIGKNRGGDHSRRGAEMMNDIGRRLDMETSDIDQLAFLVREHLTVSDTARRRDLSDPRVVREIASRLRTVETLNELTALTFCDMSTVGPNVMTDWNATLIGELYRRARQAIEGGLESVWRGQQALVEQNRDALWKLSQAKIDAQLSSGELRSQLDAFIRDVPTDHFAKTEPSSLLRQFDTYRQARQAEQTRVRFTPMRERGVTELIVCAQDVPGTLAKIAGVISASGLNIMTAEIVTTAGGRTLDIFQVSQSPPRASLVAQRSTRPPDDPRRLERLEEKLVAVLDGEVSVESLLKQRISETRLAPRPTPSVKTSVEARQDISDAFTVLEVRAPDRLGLLYEITRTLWEHDVSTYISKIDSLGTQIIDTFYVEGVGGGKLSDDKTGEVLNALYETLESSPYLDET